MSMLAQITKGKLRKPVLTMVTGVPGVGKTTFAANAPAPIFLGAESGTDQMDVARLPQPKTFADCLQAVFELTTGKHEFQTLAIDSLDWLERILHRDIAKAHEVEKIADIGYGKGFDAAMVEWTKLKDALEILRSERKMHILLIAHIQTKMQTDLLTGKEYKAFQVKLNEKAGALFQEFADCILFCTHEIKMARTDGGKERAVSNGKRVAHTVWSASFTAKNRYGLKPVIALDWQEFYDGVQAGNPQDPEVLKTAIKGMIEAIKDESLRPKILASMEGADVNKLSQIQNRCEVILQSQ